MFGTITFQALTSSIIGFEDNRANSDSINFTWTWDLAAAKQGETPVSNLELDLHPWSWTPHLLSLTPCRRSWTLHLLSCYLRLWSWNASPWSRTFYPWSWTQNVPLVTYHMPLEKDPIPLELDPIPLELKPCCLSPLITYEPLSKYNMFIQFHC